MSSGSIMLLVYLSTLNANRLPWVRVMPSVRAPMGVTDLDLEPLAQVGWVQLTSGAHDKIQVSITDAGHAACREMLAWLSNTAKERSLYEPIS
jgi:hypothetical protein